MADVPAHSAVQCDIGMCRAINRNPFLEANLMPAEFAAVQVIARLSISNLEELRGGTQLLPQDPRASIGLARFRAQ